MWIAHGWQTENLPGKVHGGSLIPQGGLGQDLCYRLVPSQVVYAPYQSVFACRVHGDWGGNTRNSSKRETTAVSSQLCSRKEGGWTPGHAGRTQQHPFPMGVCSVVSVVSDSLQSFVTQQAPLSMGFFRQVYWSGLSCPAPGDLPYPGTEPLSPTLIDGFFTTAPLGRPFLLIFAVNFHHIWEKKYWGKSEGKKKKNFIKVHGSRRVWVSGPQTKYQILVGTWPKGTIRNMNHTV